MKKVMRTAALGNELSRVRAGAIVFNPILKPQPDPWDPDPNPWIPVILIPIRY